MTMDVYLDATLDKYRVAIHVDFILEVLELTSDDKSQSNDALEGKHVLWRDMPVPLVDLVSEVRASDRVSWTRGIVLNEPAAPRLDPVLVAADTVHEVRRLADERFERIPVNSECLDRYFDGVCYLEEESTSLFRLRAPGVWKHLFAVGDGGPK